MKIAISAESTVDLTEELKQQYKIHTIPFTVNLGDQSGFDGQITGEQIIAFTNKTGILPKTSAINEYQFSEYFESLKKDYDAIIHFSLSSKLSSACENARLASKKFENVYVIDTLSLSTGIALLAIYAQKLVEQGVGVNDVYEKCLARVPNVQASFELKRLDYLYKGGRCSALTYFGANVLKIRPQILVVDGKLISGKKYRGNFERVVDNYVEDMLTEFDAPDLSTVFITYTTASEQIIEKTKQTLQARGFENIYVTRAGATITSHCGEDCLGVLYINDAKK